MNLKPIIISSLTTAYCATGLTTFAAAAETIYSLDSQSIADDSHAIANLVKLSIEELVEVKVITASKMDESINNAPGIISVITAAEIKKFGANSLYEVLERVTGIYLPSSWMSPQNVISLRGDLVPNLDTHTLLLLNGRPFREAMTNGINNTFYLSLPVIAIDRIEVIRGPGSVLYGTNAFTGVINVITKTSVSIDQPSTIQMAATAGSLGTGLVEGYVAQRQGEFKWVGSARYFREDGWEHRATDMEGVTDSEEYSERNGGLYGYGEYRNWKLNVAWLRDHQQSWGELPLWAFQFPGTENTRIFVDLGYSHEWSPNSRLEANLTYNGRQTYFSSIFDRTDEANKDILLELTHYRRKDQLFWLWGGTIYRISGRGFKISAADNTHSYYVQPYHEVLYTLYSQADYQWNQRTKLIVGGQAVKPNGLDWSFVPRLGVIHQLSPQLSIKALLSEAYRAASQFERTVRVPLVIIGNPDLKPEIVKTFDLQLLYRTKGYEGSLTYFNSQQQDLVTPFTNQEGIAFLANQSKIHFQGIELEGKLKPTDHLYVTSSLTYQTNENGAGHKNYSLTPTWTAKLGMNYEFTPQWSLGFFDNYFSAGHDSSNRFGAPAQFSNPPPTAFHLVTVNLEWKLAQDFLFNAYLYNALDEEIYTPESIISSMNSYPSRQGRGIYVGLKYSY